MLKTLRFLPLAAALRRRLQDILASVDGPKGIFADRMPVETGGAMIKRTPSDAAWTKGGLWHQSMPLNLPGLWFMSWYDVSVGPNLAAYNHVRRTARPEIADQQWAVDRKSTRLNSSHIPLSRMPSSA